MKDKLKKIAIKGHETRGNEVIELIERLGGVNHYEFKGDNPNVFFLKGILKRIETRKYCDNDRFVSFTLEEFLEKYPSEKYPYKVGDKVVSSHNKELIGTIVDVNWKNDILYTVRWCDDIDNIASYYCYDLQPYKEEITQPLLIDNDSKTDTTIDGEKLIAPNGYTILMATRNNNRLIVEYIKNKPQYPKTFQECYSLKYNGQINLNIGCDILHGAYSKELECLQSLLICRDVYWKIAGEEMGLSEPWKPNWNDEQKYKFVIMYSCNDITKETYVFKNAILTFPTEEMRDAFFENFKDLIEKCKEFL